MPTESTQPNLPEQALSPTVEPAYFLGDPRHQDVITGKSHHLFFTGKFEIVFLLANAVVFVLCTLPEMVGIANTNRLIQTGIYTKAVVTQQIGGRAHTLVIQYRVTDPSGSAHDFTSYQNIDGNIKFNQYLPGASIEVAYDAGDPANVVIPANTWYTVTNEILLTLMMGLSTLSVIGALLSTRQYLRDKKLAKKGNLLSGYLVTAKGLVDKSTYFVRFKYYVIDPINNTKKYGEQSQARNDLKGKTLPGEGTPIAVLYLNEHHFKML